jgi:molybdopterin/thiamine biosynthesis adenylyltransferase
MSKQDPFIEFSAPCQASVAVPAEFAARLPRFMGGPEDAGQRFASIRALLVGSGSIGLEIAHHLARWQAREIAVVDPKDFKSESPLTHSIPLAAVGKSKAFYAADMCKRLSPRTRVFGFKGVFDAVPLSRLAEFDVVFLATDNLLVELQVAQVSLALGIPVVQGSVHGASLCGHVRFFGHGAAEEPCAACGFTREEWAHLNRSTAFSCDGSGSRRLDSFAGDQRTLSLGANCSLIAQLVLLQFARDRLALGAPVRNTILEYCAYTHRTVLTGLIRNPTCPCDHVVLRRAVAPRPLSECTIDELTEFGNATNTDWSVEVDSSLWVEQARCNCGEWRSVRRFVNDAGKSLGRCRKCRQPLTGHPFHSHRRVPVTAIEPSRNKPLRDLGAKNARWIIVRHDTDAVLLLNHNQPQPKS